MEQTERSALDPVCGTEIDPDESEYKYQYHGTTYYFCCLNCQLDFQENPESYLSAHA